ncbi:hypothetical protein LO767_18565 [Halopseudomonas aestusnigri]|uniref:hypothetical protein n=1 Tax=Halopseudomonas aestusnigri TaxID=857252 RepID=UPI001E346A2B|nr:hypothetical protein [Halopseudomonas aestusnigri]UGV30921.1 hypothetical protein LO767_18565 [Halopseudomonas aestusnigri]
MDESELAIDSLEFARRIGLEQLVSGRYSTLLVANLIGGALSGVQNPAKIVREIRQLEQGQLGGFKAPIQNRHPPLKGLWHKHYQQDGLGSLALNVQKGLGRFGIPFFDEMIREAEAASEERYLDAEDVPALVDDIVRGNRQRLASQQALTGEWLIFAKHEGQNYYLTTAFHDATTHDRVRQQIDAVCCVEFPFLVDLLAKA